MRTSLRLLAAGILLTGPAVSIPAAATTVPAPTTAVRAPALLAKAPAGALDATGYWTAEKLRNAIPADLPPGTESPGKQRVSGSSGIASKPVAPRGQKLANDVVPSTAGKLFFTDNGLNYVCSASTINNNYKNLIITAGHCVHSGAGGNWHS